MKFSIEKATVEFRSSDKYFESEKNGEKPNTYRELTDDEIERALQATHICIVSLNGQDKFTRKLSKEPDIVKEIELKDPDKTLVIFSWTHEDAVLYG